MELTVILPFYNNEKYIKKSLISILNQSYKNWLLILINDCSTDNSLKIVNEVLKSKKISKKKYKLILNKKNLGITKSLNKALKIAKSKYIARADADDFNLRKFLGNAFLSFNASIDFALEEIVTLTSLFIFALISFKNVGKI